MKVTAKTIEGLIDASGKHAPELARLDAFVQAVVPTLKRQLFVGPSITMIGYGEVRWENKSGKGLWPLISVAPQKHHISVYVAADKDGQPLPLAYQERLGKVSIGKNCIRFRKFDHLDIEAWEGMFLDAVAWSYRDETKYGRDCARPIDQ